MTPPAKAAPVTPDRHPLGNGQTIKATTPGRVSRFDAANTSATQPATIILTDPAGDVILDAQLGPGMTVTLGGTSLPPLEAGQTYTATTTGAVSATLTTVPAEPAQSRPDGPAGPTVSP